MELKLKHLAPYLAYGLDWDISETNYGIIEKNRLTSCKLIVLSLDHITLKTNIKAHNGGVLTLNYTVGKPLLYPLSCLTEEINVDGETFVPILELAKTTYPRSIWRLHNDKCISDGYSQSIEFGYSEQQESFWIREKNHQHVPRQLALFQKLYEWHFDLHGLIDAGLAIDKRKHLNR